MISKNKIWSITPWLYRPKKRLFRQKLPSLAKNGYFEIISYSLIQIGFSDSKYEMCTQFLTHMTTCPSYSVYLSTFSALNFSVLTDFWNYRATFWICNLLTLFRYVIEYEFSSRFVNVKRLINDQKGVSHMRGSECDVRVQSNRETIHHIQSPNVSLALKQRA